MYNFREQCQSMCVVCLSLVYNSTGERIIKHIIRFGFGAPYFIRGLTGLDMSIIIFLPSSNFQINHEKTQMA